jgi:hypothetical protein
MTTRKSGVTGQPEVQEPVSQEQAFADLQLQPEEAQDALAQEKGFADVHEMRVDAGLEKEDPIVEIFIPVYDANDIIIPGLGRYVKVRQSSIDAFNARQDAHGLSLKKYTPTPDEIVEDE